MKKGFTLMEILFVLLIIALVMSFAVPAIRSVRYDIKNSNAKAALKKLAEARRSYYQATKGSDIAEGSFAADDALSYASLSCEDVAASGIPASSRENSEVSQLFACGYLDWKDFDGLPYTFYICDGGTSSVEECFIPDSNTTSTVYASAQGTAASGGKYGTNYDMSIGDAMEVEDTLD